MDESPSNIFEFLYKVWSENWLAAVFLILLGMVFLLIKSGQLPLVEIFRAIRHVYRLLRCKICGKHRYIPLTFFSSQGAHIKRGRCDTCDKEPPTL